ncbi:MAG: serine hydrolase domain-containing protein [Gemmatimonadota bacterium]
MLHRLAALSLAVLVSSSVAAQKPAARSPLSGIEAWIDSAMVKGHGVGLAVAVVKDDSIVFAKGFGVKKLGDPAPVGPKTIFAIGSTTKAFTAAALGMLVDEGRLGWDDKVTDHLPGFQLYDPAVTREITVRDLLTHRSGLSRGDRIWLGSNLSRAEVIRRVRFHKPTWSLRNTWGYQNMMFLTAGEMIPALTGTSWDDFLEERIFTPLGMTSTSTADSALNSQTDVAQPHEERDGKTITIPRRNIDNVGPAGSMHSNVLDMAQWIRFHLAGGAVAGKQLLKPATHRELFTPQMLIQSAEGLEAFYGNTPFLAYGLGWFLFDRAGRKVVEHSGGIDGMITELIMVPEEKLGVIVLSNRTSLLAFPIGHHIIDQYLGTGNVDRLGPFLASEAKDEARERAVEDSMSRARNPSREQRTWRKSPTPPEPPPRCVHRHLRQSHVRPGAGVARRRQARDPDPGADQSAQPRALAVRHVSRGLGRSAFRQGVHHVPRRERSRHGHNDRRHRAGVRPPPRRRRNARLRTGRRRSNPPGEPAEPVRLGGDSVRQPRSAGLLFAALRSRPGHLRRGSGSVRHALADRRQRSNHDPPPVRRRDRGPIGPGRQVCDLHRPGPERLESRAQSGDRQRSIHSRGASPGGGACRRRQRSIARTG